MTSQSSIVLPANSDPGTDLCYAGSTIEQLGQEIMARIAAGEKAEARAKEKSYEAETARRQAEDKYMSVGRMLIQARDYLKDHLAFQQFLQTHCGGLSKTRAYEYVALAEGRTTVDVTRAKTNERKRRHREKRKAGRFRSTGRGTEPTAGKATASATPPQTHTSDAVWTDSTDALANLKRAIDRWFPVIDDASRREIAAYVASWGLDDVSRMAN
jgi:hypothetical protein